ncbi:hypothetical protein [Haliangium sp.]|uniref:hypothetical protein n=1 Tax=Haliangium sp. TaxID=2663208 RepID=UPI003D0FFA1B
MPALAELLLALVDGVPQGAASAEAGLAVRTSRMVVEAPIEARARGRELTTSLPRGRLQTGFDLPHGRVRAHFCTVAAAEEGRDEG